MPSKAALSEVVIAQAESHGTFHAGSHTQGVCSVLPDAAFQPERRPDAVWESATAAVVL